jgi:hypothetical protein
MLLLVSIFDAHFSNIARNVHVTNNQVSTLGNVCWSSFTWYKKRANDFSQGRQYILYLKMLPDYPMNLCQTLFPPSAEYKERRLLQRLGYNLEPLCTTVPHTLIQCNTNSEHTKSAHTYLSEI